MFTPVLFVIGKSWEQPRCLSLGKWVNFGT